MSRTRAAMCVLLVGAYVAAFVALHPRLGDPVVSLSIVPLVGTAWLYGMRGGLAAGIVIVGVNIALMQTIGHHDGFEPAQLPRIVVAIAIGATAGWARDSLRRQRELLTENARITEELRVSARDLEDTVAARTRELVQSNQELTVEIAARRAAEATIERDAAARKALESRAATADRMALIGTLTAGIGHEINNPLAAIATNLEFIAEGVPNMPAPAREALDDARNAALRAGEIVRNMRIFIQSPSDADVTEVGVVVDSTVRMVANAIRHRARLDVAVDADVPPVAMSSAQLGQVLLNLLVNASHAIPEGAYDSHIIRVEARAVADRGRVLITVSDTGAGIPAEAQGRVFDPFFTTKPIGVGTGLGLWVCYQVVTAAGGEISLVSSGPSGTTFAIELSAGVRETASPAVVVTGERRGRLLVIDDDLSVCRALGRFMRGRHELVMMEDAGAALASIEGGERYDAILCDLMMPAMTGAEFFDRLKLRVPDQAARVIFMTGGSFSRDTDELLLDSRRRCIDKPFAREQLEAAIQEVMMLPPMAATAS